MSARLRFTDGSELPLPRKSLNQKGRRLPQRFFLEEALITLQAASSFTTLRLLVRAQGR